MDNSEKLTARIQRLEAAVDRYRDATVPQLRDLWAVRDADHNEAAEIAPVEYSRRITNFLRDVLSDGPAVPTPSGAPRRRAVSRVAR